MTKTDGEDINIQTYNYDYKVDEEIFLAQTEITPLRNRVILIIMTTLLMIAILLWYSSTSFPNVDTSILLVISTILALFITAGSILGGFIWKWVGFKTGELVFQIYQVPTTRIQKLLSSIYFTFVESDNQIYLEAKSRDLSLNSIKKRAQLAFTVSIPIISFFIISVRFLSRPFVWWVQDQLSNIELVSLLQNELQLGTSLLITIILITLYLPASFVLDDTNIRTWNKNSEKVGTPLSTIRSYIDGIAGIGAIGSGWTIYQEVLTPGIIIKELSSQNIVFQIIEYVILLILVLFISWPFIVPTVVMYLSNHADNVNQFRYWLINNNVSLAISNLRPPSEDEMHAIREVLISAKEIDQNL